MQNLTVNSRGNLVHFTSAHSDNEAITRLCRYVNKGELTSPFAKSLAGTTRPSTNQIAWMHKLVADHEARANPVQPAKTGGLKSIVDHLTNCKLSKEEGGKGLLHPMVALEVNGQPVVLKLCGRNSRYAGCVSISSSHKYGQGVFYGYVNLNGDYEHRNTTTPTLVDILTRIAVNPARVISELGKESGRCCYCMLELTTVQSKIAGCGKTCADNYGADYPNAAETRSYLADHPEILQGATDADRWR